MFWERGGGPMIQNCCQHSLAGHGIPSASNPDTRSLALCYLRGLMTIWIPHWILHLGMTGESQDFLGLCFLSQIDLCSLIPSQEWWSQHSGDFSPHAHQLGASTNVQCGSDTATPTLTKDYQRRLGTSLMDSLNFKNTLAQRVKQFSLQKKVSSFLIAHILLPLDVTTSFSVMPASRWFVCQQQKPDTLSWLPTGPRLSSASVKAPRPELKLISWSPLFLDFTTHVDYYLPPVMSIGQRLQSCQIS